MSDLAKILEDRFSHEAAHSHVWVFRFSANFPPNVVDRLPADIEGGVYCGWASVDNGPVYKMVLSIGWNPYYHNTKKSMVIMPYKMSRIMRKPAFCKCKNKSADQCTVTIQLIRTFVFAS